MDPRFVALLAETLPLVGDRPVTTDDRLRDLGMDSMLAVELLVAIEEVFAVALPDEELNETTFATAGSLWAAVANALAAQQPA